MPAMIISQPRTRMALSGIETYGSNYTYSPLWMDLAIRLSLESPATRSKVGCVIVTPSGGLYTGYNGTISGDDNVCEVDNVTVPELYHAEENALDKMALDKVSPEGSLVYITHSPCMICAKRLRSMKVKAVFFNEPYRLLDGAEFLEKHHIDCKCFHNQYQRLSQDY